MLQTAWLVSHNPHALNEVSQVEHPTATALRAAGMIKVDMPTQRSDAPSAALVGLEGLNDSHIGLLNLFATNQKIVSSLEQ